MDRCVVNCRILRQLWCLKGQTGARTTKCTFAQHRSQLHVYLNETNIPQLPNCFGTETFCTWLDIVFIKRRIAVESNRGIGRGVGASAQELDLIPDFKRQRQFVSGFVVENVQFLASRACDDYGSCSTAVPGGPDTVLDSLFGRFRQASKFTNIKKDPPRFVITALPRNKHDL